MSPHAQIAIPSSVDLSTANLRRGLALVGALVLVSVLLRYLGDPRAIDLDRALAPPGSGAWLGTDELGRDVASRVARALSNSVWVSVAALIVATAVGVVLGGLAGLRHRSRLDGAFTWVTSLLLSVPVLLLMVALLGLSSPSLLKAYSVLAAVLWVYPAKLVRTHVIQLRARPYVLAARAIGLSTPRILVTKLLAPALVPAVILSLTFLPEVLALEAGLSFLGLGAQPPEPGLGKMIFDGLPYLRSVWWLPVVPATALAVVVFAVTFSLRGGLATPTTAQRETPTWA